MNKLAREMLERGFVVKSDGSKQELHSNTSQEQAEFLIKQVRAVDATRTLEVGLAFGVSALCISEEVGRKQNGKHYAIDPFQAECWDNAGLRHLKEAGLSHVCEYLNQTAEKALPALSAQGEVLDFVYIDAGKRMDDTIIYARYAAEMLKVGGRIAFDDACYPGIRKALRYLVQQPQFRVVEIHAPLPISGVRKLAGSLIRALPLPKKSLFFANELLVPDEQLGIAGECVVVEKISDEHPDWKWHQLF